MNTQYTEYVVWGVKPEDKNKPEYLQESILLSMFDGEPITCKKLANNLASNLRATNIRIQAIPFYKGCESDLAKQFMGVK